MAPFPPLVTVSLANLVSQSFLIGAVCIVFAEASWASLERLRHGGSHIRSPVAKKQSNLSTLGTYLSDPFHAGGVVLFVGALTVRSGQLNSVYD